MSKASQPTVHTRIGSNNALCGRKPGDKYLIVIFPEFFGYEKEDLCARCLEIAERRGYKFQREHEKHLARQLPPLPISTASMNGGHDARI
jgi:hypothetical protein